jgi:CheY-like chemotaxis protein
MRSFLHSPITDYEIAALNIGPPVRAEWLARQKFSDRTPRRRMVRVLIADDNKDAAASLAMLFDMSGHQVRTAFDGEQAVGIATSWAPDVAILDLRMPGLDGRTVAAALRARFPKAIVVALSGHLSQGEIDRCRNMFDLCFSKGTAFPQMQQQINALIQSRHGGSAAPP